MALCGTLEHLFGRRLCWAVWVSAWPKVLLFSLLTRQLFNLMIYMCVEWGACVAVMCEGQKTTCSDHSLPPPCVFQRWSSLCQISQASAYSAKKSCLKHLSPKILLLFHEWINGEYEETSRPQSLGKSSLQMVMLILLNGERVCKTSPIGDFLT